VYFTKLLNIKIFNASVSYLTDNMFRFIRRIKNKRSGGNVVVISLHRLGDSIFTIPAIKKILNYHKENVSLICFSESIDIFKIALNNISYVGLSHDDFYFTGRFASGNVKKQLKILDPEVIYDLTGCITSASLIYNSSAEKIIGINDNIYKSIYTYFIPKKITNHISDIYNNVVQSLPELENENMFSDKAISNGIILIHPFAGWSAKEWGLKKFIDLTLTLKKDYTINFILPGERVDKITIDELKKNDILFNITNNTEELISAIKNCSAFIGNDSGPVHIANLLGKPTFTIYGPTNPDFHKPLVGKNNFVNFKVKCSPGKEEKMCYTLGGQIGCPSFECMNLLSVGNVKQELEKFLSEIKLKDNLAG
jgi:ADP-heptose:LPS heptosyltransferase